MAVCCFDRANWRDRKEPEERTEFDASGRRFVTKWVRTICGVCHAFVGYRPVDPAGRQKRLRQKTGDPQ
jgi:hypothetical protein